MVFSPRDLEGVYSSLRNRLTGKIADLTNFVPGSFNDVWTIAFSQGLRENEIQALAAQLSGWVEYAGGPITQADLDELGIDTVSPEEVNEYLEDEDLDELVSIVGINRNEGVRSTGTVTFTTVSAKTNIPEGTEVGTQPDARGEFHSYVTTELASTANGDTEVDVDVVATDVGDIFNTGAATITYLPSPPVGVQSVTNSSSTTGGVDIESNDELRERAKNAVFSTSGGGTADGVVGYIEQNTDAGDVIIEEFPDQTPPEVDVVVEGGSTTEIQEAIDFSKPVGIKHNFVRPTPYTIAMDIEITGTSINTQIVEDNITEHLNSLDISDNLYRDKIFQIIFNSDQDIVNTTLLEMFATNEAHTYQTGTSIYQINKADEMDYTTNVTEISGVLNGSSHVFTKNIDYSVIDNGSGHLDSIDWSTGGDSPDDGTEFYIDYKISNDMTMGIREQISAGSINITVV